MLLISHYIEKIKTIKKGDKITENLSKKEFSEYAVEGIKAEIAKLRSNCVINDGRIFYLKKEIKILEEEFDTQRNELEDVIKRLNEQYENLITNKIDCTDCPVDIAGMYFQLSLSKEEMCEQCRECNSCTNARISVLRGKHDEINEKLKDTSDRKSKLTSEKKEVESTNNFLRSQITKLKKAIKELE